MEAELAAERAENATLRQQMEQVLARLREVEGQLAKDSHNSSKRLPVMVQDASGSASAARSQREDRQVMLAGL